MYYGVNGCNFFVQFHDPFFLEIKQFVLILLCSDMLQVHVTTGLGYDKQGAYRP